MSACARGCCWSPFSCAQSRTCACHWDERKPTGQAGESGVHSDPTANQAIRNIMKEREWR